MSRTGSTVPRRPSMMNGEAPDSSLDNPLSILTALEEAPASSSKRPWRKKAIWMLAIAASCLLAAAALSGVRTPLIDKQRQLSTAQQPRNAESILALSNSQSTPIIAPAQTQIRQYAALEDVAASMPTGEPAGAASAVPPSNRGPLADLPTVKTTSPATAGAPSAPKPPKATTSKQETAKVARRTEPSRSSGNASSGDTRSKAGVSEDADVDLIAALMQHMNRQAAGGRHETIADLVAQCKSLDGPEALQCQRRICDNYWGRADACPRSLAPAKKAVSRSGG